MTSLEPGQARGRPPLLRPSRLVVPFGLALAAAVAVAAGTGLFTDGGPGPHSVVSLRGQPVDVYGVGVYRYDSWLIGVGNRGTDAITWFLELPALLTALAVVLTLARVSLSSRRRCRSGGLNSWVPWCPTTNNNGPLPRFS